ncbi:MAG: hypothetical protein ACFFCD_02610 [Promethearchaeota archaeon]
MVTILHLGDFVYISYVLVFSLSGILLYSLIFPETQIFEKIIIGTAFSFVFMIYLGFLVSYIATFEKIPVIIANIMLIVVLGIFFVFKNKQSKKKLSSTLKNIIKKILESKWMLLILLLSIIFRIGPMLFSELPLGDDPTFHVLVAKLIVDNKEIPVTFEPYEPIPINYPLGSHIILASFSTISEIAVHTVFKYLILLFGVLSVSAVYVLGELVFKKKMIALCCMFSYGLLPFLGGLGYYGWGGLPNEIAMFFLLGIVIIFLRETNELKKGVMCGFLTSGVILTHHLSVLALLVIFLIFGIITSLAQRGISPDLKSFGKFIVLALVFSSFYLFSVIFRVSELQQTTVFNFWEDFRFTVRWTFSIGVLFTFFSVIGIGKTIFNTSEEHSREEKFILTWIASLLFAFAMTDRTFRFIKFFQTGSLYTVAFVPSRFMTDMIYPLSIFSGMGLFLVVRTLWVFVKQNVSSLTIRKFLLLLFFVAIISEPLFFLQNGISYARSSEINFDAIYWIKTNTSKNALIVNEGQEGIWIPYLTEREVTKTFLPNSEYIFDKYIVAKKELHNLLIYDSENNNIPQIIENWDRPIFVYSPKEIHSKYFEEVYRGQQAIVYRIRSEA